MKRKKVFFLSVVIVLMVFLLTACPEGEFHLRIEGPIFLDPGSGAVGNFQGIIVNETNYTIRVDVEVHRGKKIGSTVLSPNQKAYISLQEKRYSFSAVRAHSEESVASTTLHIDGIKNDAYYNESYYDWYVIFSPRRTRTHS